MCTIESARRTFPVECAKNTLRFGTRTDRAIATMIIVSVTIFKLNNIINLKDQLQPLRIIEIEVNIADIDMVDRFKLHINELDLVILLIDFSDIELLSEPSETRMLHQVQSCARFSQISADSLVI